MKNIKLFTRATILSAPLLFAFATQPVWADADAHDHHDLSSATLELNQGQKWAIDAPLRQGMNAIHGIVAGAIEQIHANQMSASGYQQLTTEINEQLAYIFENCELPADADAQLHIVLANVMHDLEAVEGKAEDKSPSDGVVGIAQMLNSYGDFFDHQGWQAIDLSH